MPRVRNPGGDAQNWPSEVTTAAGGLWVLGCGHRSYIYPPAGLAPEKGQAAT